MIRIGETYDLTPRSAAHALDSGFDEAGANEAANRLVEAVAIARRNMKGHYISAKDLWFVDAALASFTESDR